MPALAESRRVAQKMSATDLESRGVRESILFNLWVEEKKWSLPTPTEIPLFPAKAYSKSGTLLAVEEIVMSSQKM